MAKVEGMRGKDNSKPVFVKKGAPNIAPTFRNNNVNNNNKRLNAGRDAARDKRVKMEGRQLAENCKFCDKPGHRAEECWKKLGACLRCGGLDHRIPDYPMMKDQPVFRCRPVGVRTTESSTGGRVEELLVAEELWNDHKKLIFFTFSSAATCTNRPLEGDQSTLCQYKAVLDRNPRTCPFPVGVWRTPCERDSPIGHILRSCRESKPRRVLNAMQRSVATLLPDLTAPSRSSHHPVAFWSRPVTTLTRGMTCVQGLQSSPNDGES
ncbi:hypothetical protein Taro_005170 [Colocasia esculenta]|uniref:CCHC-type domain-containing protein n=1 Tax=Colocasia esculenta TaxID=4460 RepID=A0A843TK66_COLES|nr:hypothetical protein [Colocasia esculenta]